jgi:hypothetical protein
MPNLYHLTPVAILKQLSLGVSVLFVESWAKDQTSLLKNHPKSSPTSFVSELLHKLYGGKKFPKVWAPSVIFKETTQRKQSPKSRKFAQSGHPAKDLCYVLQNIFAQKFF